MKFDRLWKIKNNRQLTLRISVLVIIVMMAIIDIYARTALSQHNWLNWLKTVSVAELTRCHAALLLIDLFDRNTLPVIHKWGYKRLQK